jgi:hypothetical protein
MQERQRMKPNSRIRAEIHVKGDRYTVPGVEVGNTVVIVNGRFRRVASVLNEELIEGDSIADIGNVIQSMRDANLHADILTFAERPPSSAQKYKAHIAWENVAAVSTKDYAEWEKKLVSSTTRKAINRAKREGVIVREVEFCEGLAHSIHAIYNESSVRQGKQFWHFGKDVTAVQHAMSDYLDRSVFLGAFLGTELIGFIKLTWVGSTGVITQIISMKKHFDKRPNNALIAKAVEVCSNNSKSYLIYGSYVYYDPDSSLTEFKRRNGFVEMEYPRYYFPLTWKGKALLALRMHRDIREAMPRSLYRLFLRLRTATIESKARLLSFMPQKRGNSIVSNNSA